MQIPSPIYPAEQGLQERADVMNVQVRKICLVDDLQVLGQRQLALAKQRIGLGEQLLWP